MATWACFSKTRANCLYLPRGRCQLFALTLELILLTGKLFSLTGVSLLQLMFLESQHKFPLLALFFKVLLPARSTLAHLLNQAFDAACPVCRFELYFTA